MILYRSCAYIDPLVESELRNYPLSDSDHWLTILWHKNSDNACDSVEGCHQQWVSHQQQQNATTEGYYRINSRNWTEAEKSANTSRYPSNSQVDGINNNKGAIRNSRHHQQHLGMPTTAGTCVEINDFRRTLTVWAVLYDPHRAYIFWPWTSE